MKRLAFFIVLTITFLGCNNYNEVKNVADSYVNDNILPLYPNSKLSEMILKPSDHVTLVKNDTRCREIAVGLETLLLQRKQRQSENIKNRADLQIRQLEREYEIIASGGKVPERVLNVEEETRYNEELEFNSTTNEIDYYSIEALRASENQNGVYIVSVGIEYGDNKRETFSIIVSKDLKVLNKFEDKDN